jgi:hypothetical protein
MTHLTRRELLRSATGAIAASSVVGFPAIVRAAGPVWGEVPAGVWATPPDLRILEIHLMGGMAPFESFYFRPDPGPQTRGFDVEIATLPWNAACPGTPAPGSPLVTQLHGNDSNMSPVHLGPLAKPLWPSHLSSRMRVIVQSHDLMPHEAAIPYVMTGLRLGRSNQASLGSAIQHRYRALDADAGLPVRPEPYCYGLLPQQAGLNNLLFSMMGALGTHPGSAKPLVLRLGPTFGTFLAQLNRANSSSEADALLDQLRGQYRDRLRFQGSTSASALTRSRGFEDYDVAVSNLFRASSISTFLGALPSTIANSASCASESGTFENNPNVTRTALEAAVHLLTRPASQRARYVHVVDSGLTRQDGFPYDVHDAGNATDTGSNLWNTLSKLASLVRDPANPSPTDASKLDLDNTMIHITTEFGRTPFKSSGNSVNPASLGRDHWPAAFCSVLIGGPVVGPKVVGAISDAGAVATTSYSPTDTRAAMLVAMGIDPFAPENYALGQLSAEFSNPPRTHLAAMTRLRDRILVA